MGLYQTIKDNNIYITMHRGSSKDSYLYFDLSEAITHFEKILRGISETKPTISSLYDLLNYFALTRIESFAESLTTINDEDNNEIIRKLSAAAGEVTKRYSIGDIIKYINNEYESLIGKCKNGVTEISRDMQVAFFPLVEFCIKYQTGINDDVFLFLAAYRSDIYISYYDDLKKKLLDSWNLFDKVFSPDNISNFVRSHCRELLMIAKSVGQSSAEEKIKNAINNRIFECSVNIMNTIEERDTIIYSDSVRRVRRYFSEINYDQQKLAYFEKVHNQFDEKVASWMDKNGKVFSYDIPSEIADRIFNCDAQWITKLLRSTHTLKKGKLVSQFSFDALKHNPLVDLASHNIDTDEYFSYSRQQQIQILGSVGAAFVLQTFVNEQYLNDITDWIGTALRIIAERCGFDTEDLIADLSAIIQSIQFVDVATKERAYDCGAPLIYGTCILIIACIEKLLRLVYKFENKIILSDELIQLKGLLNNLTISNILTEDLMKGVGFYLSRYEYIGLNYRNRLAHLSGIKVNEISSTLPHTFFYLYMCVINGMFIYYCTDENS